MMHRPPESSSWSALGAGVEAAATDAAAAVAAASAALALPAFLAFISFSLLVRSAIHDL
jgi:hypothetical protein